MAYLQEIETGERQERDRTRHNNSPPTKRLRLRLGWGWNGVVGGLRLGWGSEIEMNIVNLKLKINES